MIRDFFALVPKGSSKTTYSAALMLVAMLMNFRPRATALFIGETQAVADRAYEQAVGMIEESPTCAGASSRATMTRRSRIWSRNPRSRSPVSISRS
jgi:phage terminase large subunit-like protein